MVIKATGERGTVATLNGRGWATVRLVRLKGEAARDQCFRVTELEDDEGRDVPRQTTSNSRERCEVVQTFSEATTTPSDRATKRHRASAAAPQRTSLRVGTLLVSPTAPTLFVLAVDDESSPRDCRDGEATVQPAQEVRAGQRLGGFGGLGLGGGADDPDEFTAARLEVAGGQLMDEKHAIGELLHKYRRLEAEDRKAEAQAEAEVDWAAEASPELEADAAACLSVMSLKPVLHAAGHAPGEGEYDNCDDEPRGHEYEKCGYWQPSTNMPQFWSPGLSGGSSGFISTAPCKV